MSLSFEKNTLLLGLTGGAFINAAIVAMNTLPGKNMQKMGGVPLFAIGWIMIIKSFLDNETRDSKYKNILAISSICVFSMAVTARMMTDAGKTGMSVKTVKMIFMAAWIVIGISIGMKKHADSDEESHDMTMHALGLLPPVLVVLSMTSINKMERPRSMASGPGMPIFSFAWVILSLVNSIKI